VPRLRLRCRGCGLTLSTFTDASLDESGLRPEALARVQQANTLLPYRQAARLLASWGVLVSKSQAHRLSAGLEAANREVARETLSQRATMPLERTSRHTRRWVIEIDGVIVPTVEPAAPGKVVWREVKIAVLYKMNAPSGRFVVTHLGGTEDFGPLVHGLLRHAGVTQADQLIGVSDGAVWIATLMGDLGVHQHILDVFHTSQYLEKLMVGLAWDEADRSSTRSALLRGEVDVRAWLNVNVPANPKLVDEARGALSYLEKQAELEHTTYPKFKAQGIEVIGSGQVEGANKSLIGARLKVSGARWREQGANGKAFARAEYEAERCVVVFDVVRQRAFKQAA